MIKRRITYIICILLAIICLQGCTNQPHDTKNTSNISNEIWCNPVYLPKDIDQTNMRMLNLPNRQQYVYKSANGQNRIVVDIHTGNEDNVDIEAKQNIDIKLHPAITYYYNGEEFSFAGVSAAEAAGLVRMTAGENVLEWIQGDAYFRLHGTYSLDELIAIAEALEVRLP